MDSGSKQSSFFCFLVFFLEKEGGGEERERDREI